MKAGLDRLRIVLEEKAGKACAGTWSRCWTRTMGPSSFAATTTRSRRSSRAGACREHATGTFKGGMKRSRPIIANSRTAWLDHHAAGGHDQRPRLRGAGGARARRRAGVPPGQRPQLPEQRQCLRQPGRGSRGRGPARRGAGEYEEAIKRGEAAKDPLLDAFRAHRDACAQEAGREP